MATLASPSRTSTPPKKWKNRLSIGKSKKKSKFAAETPKEADNGVGRSLAASRNQRKKGGKLMRKLGFSSKNNKEEQGYESDTAGDASPSNPQSPYSVATVESNLDKEQQGAFVFTDSMEERQRRELIYQKQQIKERDGFCRRVDTYDGSVIAVDGKPTYEIGNYLGGGVAGVVYEGHRLRPLEEYPVRNGIDDAKPRTVEVKESPKVESTGFFCGQIDFVQNSGENACGNLNDTAKEDIEDEQKEVDTPRIEQQLQDPLTTKSGVNQEDVDVAIEATIPGVMLDAQDAPSRSTHYTRAASVQLAAGEKDQSLNHGLTEAAVAIKILNPVGYRILQPDGLKGVVVIKEGEPMGDEVKKGLNPMEERHVWWLVNPNSRNLRTLQRYSGKGDRSSVQVDRGTAQKGLRLSLIAAYIDPRSNELRELTLTRCIEIWGHIPFNVTDIEFEDTMTAIERVNAGQPPLPIPAFESSDENPPSRVGTDTSHQSNSENGFKPVPLKAQRTGLMRAAYTERTTVFCRELTAHIAIPAVPSKYLRWLRQRRSATKEVRNMMLIGRHKNVLHLFEVLEFIQESKSTMFLILELVKGGELFDLISSSAGKGSADDESKLMMRRFFYELASGIHYCHQSGIAHRDLKPENLLVHNGDNGECTLKIADFGLSSQFGAHSYNRSSTTLVTEDVSATPSSNEESNEGATTDTFNKVMQSGVSALSFLTCGAMSGLCAHTEDFEGPDPLRRMTSVVGSPHYVAPEIISQNEDSKRTGRKSGGGGYDGSKADVWSAGVILYAMLFQSLPFGEDLLRCPRFQSYKKWYDGIRDDGGRRSSAEAALSPTISDSEERDYLGPHWFFPASSSRESRDLIVAMLNPKPADRLSVDQVLMHSWVLPEKTSRV